MPEKLRSALFLGRKPGAALALQHLLDRGIEVALCFAPALETYQPSLRATAAEHNIPFLTEERELYRRIPEADLVISYLFWRRMKMPLIRAGRIGCINFHPAPLPDYKSRAGYNMAILDHRNDYAVSVHFVDSEKLDDGPIIEVADFPVDPDTETALSLERKAQKHLLDLFKKTIDAFIEGREIKTRPNTGGLYLTAEQLEALKEVKPSDSAELIHRKCRAFFFPPYSGAYLMIDGVKFTLIDQTILDLLALNQIASG